MIIDQTAYVFDYDNTIAPPNRPINDPAMTEFLARLIIGGATLCIVTAKSLLEREGLLIGFNDVIQEQLTKLACSEPMQAMERLTYYTDSGSTRHINHQGQLRQDQTFQKGFNNDQMAVIAKALADQLAIPAKRIIQYPGNTEAQYRITDAWAHLGHAIVHRLHDSDIAAKLLVKAYGWAEEEYDIENLETANRPSREDLAKDLQRRLTAAGLDGVAVHKGGSVALDITAADKSAAIAHIYQLGHRNICYFGDDPEGSDKPVFELNDAPDLATRFPGMELRVIKVDSPQHTAALLAEVLARGAVKTFMDEFAANGQAAVAPIKTIAAIAANPVDDLAKAGLRALFQGIVEPLNDAYMEPQRLAYYQAFAQVIDYCRHLPGGVALDQALGGFGLRTAADLVERTMRIRRPAPMDAAACRAVRQVFVLSRITIGADIALTSIVFEKAINAFPQAQIIFVGPATTFPLFAGNPRLHLAAINYQRKGGLIGRLNTWLEVLQTIRDGCSSDDYVIIDPDTRLGQVGLLPFSADDRNYFFFEPELKPGVQLARSLSAWLDATFVEAEPKQSYTKLYLTTDDQQLSNRMLAPFGLEAKPVIGIHLGAGGAMEKTLSIGFETELLRRLLADGATVLLYKGVNAAEEQRTQDLVQRLNALGISSTEISEHTQDPVDTEARVIAFARTQLGVSTALLGHCQQIVSYSSSSKHIAGALRVPVTIIYVRDLKFADKWAPYTASPVNLLRIAPMDKAAEQPFLEQVLSSTRRLAQWNA